MDNRLIKDLEKKAYKIRRRLIEISCRSRSSHISSSLSQIDILTALYFYFLKINPRNPNNKNRDRFILSKGHAALSYYLVLAERGFFSFKEIENFGKDNSKLASHPVYRSLPGIEATSGSLGHGLSMGVGLALASKKERRSNRVVVLISDGDCDEGSTWEAVLLAGHLKLDNIVAIVDYNKLQAFGTTKEVLNLDPLADKWKSFNWEVREINGHNFHEILKALDDIPYRRNKPSVIIAHTIKGKGVAYMENKVEWHYFNIKPEDLDRTLDILY